MIDVRASRLDPPHRSLWRVAPFALALGVIAAARVEAEETAEAAGKRLDFMKRSVGEYVVTPAEGEKPADLIAEPLLRWNNPVSNVPDGTIFLWKDARSQPVAIVQVFILGNTKDLWLHEFQSLTTSPLSVKQGTATTWNPRRGGITYKPLADAPAPAETKTARLTQMRQIAKRFQFQDDFEGKSRWELRLMTTPLYRYGSDEGDVVDGAIFAYAHGTDPEGLLLLEARRSDKGGALEWHHALAPMTGYALTAKDRDQEVWSIGWRQPPYDLNEPFACIEYHPRP
ncbi:hypothetical protein [Planctomyces sp. SH-PL14]|uniref:hypothetical protein n=1 Tax=Planctomyces sp. SH-PL14 TaxID=1632864 RepID=UPI00078BC099|nr:hypothetical protein [Planctomyces sp. SH-PL14]AMV20855.1 hypothetical protein VT03_23335 [Planctomyces sp. SH-PL14]